MSNQGSDQRPSLSVDDVRREGFKILPLCPFAKGQFERHPEWRDVL